MTMTDSLPPTIAGPANDDTDSVLAYSDDDAGDREPRRGLLDKAPTVAALLLGLLGVVSAVGASTYAMTHNSTSTASKTVTVAAPPETVTVTNIAPPLPARTVSSTVTQTITATAQTTARTIPDTPVTADDVYIREVDNAGLWIYDAPPMITLGHQQCEFLRTAPGNTADKAIAALQTRYRALNPVQASGIVNGAIKAYCPEFAGSR